MKRKNTNPTKTNIFVEKSSILKIIACAASICLIGASIKSSLNYYRKQKRMRSNIVQENINIELSTIKNKIKKAGIELQEKKANTKLCLEIRELANNLSFTNKLLETRLVLAKFLNWRLSFVKAVNIKEELQLIMRLLNFEATNLKPDDLGDFIGIRFQTIFSSGDFIQLEHLRSELAGLKFNCSEKHRTISQTQFDVVSFKLACIFSDWNMVEKFGKKVAEYNNIIVDKYGKQCRIPMMLRFEQDAQQIPGQQPNYYEIFHKRSLLKNRFEPSLLSLQLKDLKILSIKKNFSRGFSHNMQRLRKQFEKQKSEGWKTLDNNLQKVWIYGGIVQMQLTILGSSKTILCGAWNLNEMFLSAVVLSSISKQGMQMRLEFTLQLNRHDWRTISNNKSGWLWKGKLVFKRFIPNETSMQLGKEPWMKFSTETNDLEIILEEIN